MVGPVAWSALLDVNPELSAHNRVHGFMPVEVGDQTRMVQIPSGEVRDETMKTFCDGLLKIYDFPEKPLIRDPTAEEFSHYWAVIAFPIEEPVFVVELGERNLLLDFSAESGVLMIEEVDHKRLQAIVNADVEKQLKAEADADKVYAAAMLSKHDDIRDAIDEVTAESRRLLFEEGDLAGALRQCARLRLMAPKEPDGWANEGQMRLMLIGAGHLPRENLVTVLQLFESAHEIDPENPKLMGDVANSSFNVANSLPEDHGYRKVLFARGEEMVAKAIEKDPDFATYYYIWITGLTAQARKADARKIAKFATDRGIEIPDGIASEIAED